MNRGQFPVSGLAGWRAASQHFVSILTGNDGVWTLGCHGNHDIRTPQIEEFAWQGRLFMRVHASNVVCSPTCESLHADSFPSTMRPHVSRASSEFRGKRRELHGVGSRGARPLCRRARSGNFRLRPRRAIHPWRRRTRSV